MAGEPREDAAEVVALLLELRGMESIEVDGAAFSPDVGASFDDQAAAFAAFVKERDLSTEYALYGAVIGSPQRGVDEIRGVLVDGSGHVSPMDCSVFLVERLQDPLDLHEPREFNASEGTWADRARRESLAPTDAESDAMKERLARLRNARPTATVLVYPVRTGDSWSVECARRLADEINRRGLLDASVAESRLEFEIQPARNQQKVLWSGARSIQQLVRANPPRADYVLCADYLMFMSRGSSKAGGVHTFLLESDGDWVIVDYQNSHHRDFNRINPTSLDKCCELSVVRLDRYLGS
jgi:hypothetical protein